MTAEEMRVAIHACEQTAKAHIATVREVVEELTQGLDDTAKYIAWMLFYKWSVGQYQNALERLEEKTFELEDESDENIENGSEDQEVPF